MAEDQATVQIPKSEPKRTWNHRICEVCWFAREPQRFPASIIRELGDHVVDQCCFCGTWKITRIYVRHDPADSKLLCSGLHVEGQW